MTRYMLDTNIVSYVMKGESPFARQRLVTLRPDETACISTITEGELRYGLESIGNPPRRLAYLEQFLSLVAVLSWGREEAAVYGQLRVAQEERGKPLEPFDMLIAAHAIAAGAVLVTSDKAFRHVTGFAGLENWAIDAKPAR